MLLNCATFSGGPHAAPAQPLPEWGVAVGSRRPSLLTWPVEAILGKRPVVKSLSLSALGGLVFHGWRPALPGLPATQRRLHLRAGRSLPATDRARAPRDQGRGGKTVTTISGLPLAGDALKELASALKRRCGTGGSLKDGVVEIQGEHVELLIDELLKRGFKAKKSGG